MTKKITDIDPLASNKILQDFYKSPMYKIAAQTQKLLPPKQIMEVIKHITDIENNFLEPAGLYKQILKSQIKPVLPAEISGIVKGIQDRMLDKVFLIDDLSSYFHPNISMLELHLDAFDKEEGTDEEVTEIIHTTPKLIKSIYEDEGLLKILNSRKFEEVVAELLYSKGFEVELTKQTRDGGYDILALSKIAGIPFKMIVECKRYNKTVGVGIIREFCDVISLDKPNKGMIITTNYFSNDAIERKKKMGAMLDLKDRDDLLDWIFEYVYNSNN